MTLPHNTCHDNLDAESLANWLQTKGMENIHCEIRLHEDASVTIEFRYTDLMGDRTYKTFRRMSYHDSDHDSAYTQAVNWLSSLPNAEDGLKAMKRAKILEAVETLESLGVDSDSVNAIRTIADKLASNAITDQR